MKEYLMVKLLSYHQKKITMSGKCQNCGKVLEDSILTHCSNKCLFEGYLKSK